MCLVHAPGAPPPPPPPQYLHNPYLDGASMGQGLNKGRNSLVTMGNGGMPAPVSTPTPQTHTQRGLSAPSGGTTMPQMGQPGVVMPTVGGVMAGAMAGRVSTPIAPVGMARK